jgi:hypothetical protein
MWIVKTLWLHKCRYPLILCTCMSMEITLYFSEKGFRVCLRGPVFCSSGLPCFADFTNSVSVELWPEVRKCEICSLTIQGRTEAYWGKTIDGTTQGKTGNDMYWWIVLDKGKQMIQLWNIVQSFHNLWGSMLMSNQKFTCAVGRDLWKTNK